MGLLWKSDNPVLPYNRTLAEARLQHLKRRFLRDPELEVKYRAVIEDCVTKGGSSNSQQNHMVPASPPSKQSEQARQGESGV